ncbi:MAG: MFS transporter [Simkaniaceae bacterium]|nr:MFS transporter [Simkaniaceae bacterium]
MSRSTTCGKTKTAFLSTRILSAPFWGMFHMLPFILYKDLGAGALPITLLITLKPMVALLAPYWSARLHNQQERLLPNLISANILKYLPFLLTPYFTNPYLLVLSSALFMVLVRGVIPAWMEVLKRNIEKEKQSHLFALGSALDYLAMALLPLAFGFLLDAYPGLWRWIFFWTALLGIFSTLFLTRIPSPPPSQPSTPLTLLKPWKQTLLLLKKRPDFTRFQIGFMLGGSGLMLMQPALPQFFVDSLHLSYTKMFTALVFCKSMGYAASSPLWAHLYNKINIFTFSASVTLLATLFPFFLIGAIFHPSYLYLGYIAYGIMQGGSEMSWNLSGPHFSQNEDSSSYSQTNVLSVGIRGALIPPLGALLYSLTGSAPLVILGGAFLCSLATLFLYRGQVKNIITLP